MSFELWKELQPILDPIIEKAANDPDSMRDEEWNVLNNYSDGYEFYDALRKHEEGTEPLSEEEVAAYTEELGHVQPYVSTLGSIGRGALDSLTFGFGDEIAGAVSEGGNEDADLLAGLDRAHNKWPTLAAQAGTGLAMSLAPLTWPGRIGQLFNWANRGSVAKTATASGVIGAGSGALSGAGASEEGDRATGAVVGGSLGLLGGLAGGVAGGAVDSAGRAFGHFTGRTAADDALKVVADDARGGPGTATGVSEQMSMFGTPVGRGVTGPEESVQLRDLSPNLRRRALEIARQGDEPAERMLQAASQRADDLDAQVAAAGVMKDRARSGAIPVRDVSTGRFRQNLNRPPSAEVEEAAAFLTDEAKNTVAKFDALDRQIIEEFNTANKASSVDQLKEVKDRAWDSIRVALGLRSTGATSKSIRNELVNLLTREGRGTVTLAGLLNEGREGVQKFTTQERPPSESGH